MNIEVGPLASNRLGTKHIKDLLVYLLIVAPFFMIFLIANRSHPTAALGFIQYDQGSYMANAREIFERGSFGFYPNPFDPSVDAPVVFFSFIAIVLGTTMKVLNADPGLVYQFVGLLAALTCVYLTHSLIRRTVNDRGYFLLVLTFWSGGLFSAPMIIDAILTGSFPLFSAEDPFGGWAIMNWGRNLIVTTEATYHALAAGFFLCCLMSKWRIASVLLVVITLTHPFTAIQINSVALCWIVLCFFKRPNSVPRFLAAIPVINIIVTLVYYSLFLPSFPTLSSLLHSWSLP